MNKKIYFILAIIIFSNLALNAARPKPLRVGFEPIEKQGKNRNIVTNLYNEKVLPKLPEIAVLKIIGFLYNPVPGSQRPPREQWRSNSLLVTPPRSNIRQAPPAPKRPRRR